MRKIDHVTPLQLLKELSELETEIGDGLEYIEGAIEMKLGEIFDTLKGRKPAAILTAPEAGAKRLIQIEDLRHNNNLKFCPDSPYNVEAGEDDVIIAWDGAIAGTASFGLRGIIGSTLAVLRRKPNSKQIFTPYVGRFVQAQEAHLRRTCKGATVPHIQKAVLDDLNVSCQLWRRRHLIRRSYDQADSLGA